MRSDGGSTIRVSLYGELDIAGVDDLDQEFAGLAGSGPRDMVLDLSGLDFVDSTGLTCLLKAHDLAKAQGFRLWIVPGDGAVHRVLTLTGLNNVLPLVGRTPDLGAAPAPRPQEAMTQ